MGTMLSSLLPGLREVRAPLIGGYLWLCGLWLAVGPSLPARSRASGLLGDVVELADRLPQWAVFGGISVVAYLIGTLVEDLVRAVRQRQSATYAYEEFTDYGKRPRANASPQADTSLHLLISERVREAHGELTTAGEGISSLSQTLIRETDEAYGVENEWAEDAEGQQLQLATALHTQTLRELGLVGFRLMGDEPVLYGNVDRTRAEAELRLAVALPLVFIGVVLGFRVGGPWWVGAIVAIGLAALGGVLIWQGQIREERANDALVDAMFINKVQPPALDQLRRATQEIVNETDAQRSERRQRQEVEREKRRKEREHMNEHPEAAWGC